MRVVECGAWAKMAGWLLAEFGASVVRVAPAAAQGEPVAFADRNKRVMVLTPLLGLRSLSGWMEVRRPRGSVSVHSGAVAIEERAGIGSPADLYPIAGFWDRAVACAGHLRHHALPRRQLDVHIETCSEIGNERDHAGKAAFAAAMNSSSSVRRLTYQSLLCRCESRCGWGSTRAVITLPRKATLFRSSLALLASLSFVMTPVSAWNTVDSAQRMIQQSIDNVAGFFQDRPINIVNATQLSLNRDTK